MKERGILFSSPMVRALLDGTKTQTRRIVKPQPMESDGQIYGGKLFGPEMYEPAAYDKHGEMIPGPEIFGIYTEDGDWGIKCPYGKPGDQLWVRETFAEVGNVEPGYLLYRASDYMEQVRAHRFDTYLPESNVRWTPSIHMPRWASRIDLEITGVRVERLNEISEADAKAEGCDPYDVAGLNSAELALLDAPLMDPATPYKNGYALLWESLAGPGSWNVNSWVWVVEFRRVKP